MLAETGVAAYLIIWLILFIAVDLHNILRFHRGENGAQTSGEAQRLFKLAVALAALGTFVYFLAVVLFFVLVLVGQESVVIDSSLGYELSDMVYEQVLGLGLTALGYATFMWSVIARGRHAVSWEMPVNQKLVTWGPYRYVRHPSYLGYFFMFIGFFCLWPNWLTFFPWIAIPAYYQITFYEERLLTRRFGKEYREYQARTGRLVPRFR